MAVLFYLCGAGNSSMRAWCSECGVRQAANESGMCVGCLQSLSERQDNHEIQYSHACPDWDFMVIDETMPEWRACTCFPRSVDEAHNFYLDDEPYFDEEDTEC